MTPADRSEAGVAQRIVRVVALAALVGLLWSIVCLAPLEDWNSARLLPAALIGAGRTIYFAPNEGPAIGWIYGPVMPVIMSVASWLPSATGMVIVAALINAALLLVPIAMSTNAFARIAGMDRDRRALLVLTCLAGALVVRWIDDSLRFIHADATAVSLGLISCVCLVRGGDDSRWRWFAAATAVLSVWSKQLAVAVPIAQIMWVWRTDGRKPAQRYAGRFVIAGIAMTAGWVVVFGWRELWHNLFVVPSHHPMKGAWSIAVREAGWLALGCAPFAAMIYFLRDRVFHRGVTLLVLVAVLQFPLGALGAWKVGGGSNAFHSIYYLFAGACWQLASSGGGWAAMLRTRMMAVMVAVLAVAAVVVREREGWRVTPAPHLAESVDLAKDLKGEVLFPRNPLVTWYTERRIYHLEYGFLDQAIAGFPASGARLQAWLPPHLGFIAYQTGPIDHPFVRLLSGFDRTVRIGNLTVHVAPAASMPAMTDTIGEAKPPTPQ